MSEELKIGDNCPECKLHQMICESEIKMKQCWFCYVPSQIGKELPKVPAKTVTVKEKQETLPAYTGYTYTPVKKEVSEYDEFKSRKKWFGNDDPTEYHPLIKTLVIPCKMHSLLQTHCNVANTEVSGLGYIKIVGDKAIFEKFAFLDQTDTAGSTIITEDTITKFQLRLIRTNQDTEFWKVWWHTHYNFGVFWSGIDEANIKQMQAYLNGYLISVVINQEGNLLARIDEKGIRYKMDVIFEPYSKYKNLHKRCVEMNRKHVKAPVWKMPNWKLPKWMKKGKKGKQQEPTVEPTVNEYNHGHYGYGFGGHMNCE